MQSGPSNTMLFARDIAVVQLHGKINDATNCKLDSLFSVSWNFEVEIEMAS